MFFSKKICGFLLFLTIFGCSSPRYKVIFIDKKNFQPLFEGQKIKIQVYDFDEESLAPLESLYFQFEPDKWGQIKPIPGKKYQGELEVKTIYNSNSPEMMEYKIIPKQKAKKVYSKE